MKLSVIIPAFNEEERIVETLREINEYLFSRNIHFEIIVVDDGSTDRTVARASKFNTVSLLHNQQNHGKGYSVRRGVLASNGDMILFMDADNSTSIRELDHFLDEIKGADGVIGSRALATSRIEIHQPMIKRIAGRFGNLLIRTLLGLSYQDTQCGFKLFSSRCKELFVQQKLDRWGFDFELLFLAMKRGFSIREVPVSWRNRFESRVSIMSYLTTIVDLLKIRIWYAFGSYKQNN